MAGTLRGAVTLGGARLPRRVLHWCPELHGAFNMILIITIAIICGLGHGRLPLNSCAGTSVVVELVLGLSRCFSVLFHNDFHGQTHWKSSHLLLSLLPSHCQQR